MNKSTLVFSDYDVERLEDILDSYRHTEAKHGIFDALAGELGKGNVVPANKMPPDVVTLNSRIMLRDLDKNTQMEVTLVLPTNADFAAGRLSVASPIGTAVLGYAVGMRSNGRYRLGSSGCGLKRFSTNRKVLGIFTSKRRTQKKSKDTGGRTRNAPGHQTEGVYY
jgi:regulator of nucleoside diphosphate kinase